MARLRIHDTPVDVEVSKFNRPKVWFDPFRDRVPKADRLTAFRISYSDSTLLAQYADHYGWVELSEGETILRLRGCFPFRPILEVIIKFPWDACELLDSGEEKLYLDWSKYEFRRNGRDLLPGRRWALGLEDEHGRELL